VACRCEPERLAVRGARTIPTAGERWIARRLPECSSTSAARAKAFNTVLEGAGRIRAKAERLQSVTEWRYRQTHIFLIFHLLLGALAGANSGFSLRDEDFFDGNEG
jgi:hypothetical protein